MITNDSAHIEFWYARLRDHNRGVSVMSREDLVKAKITVDEALMAVKADIATAKSQAAATGEYLDPSVYGVLLGAKASCAKLSNLFAVALADEKKRRKAEHESAVARKGEDFKAFYRAAKDVLPAETFEQIRAAAMGGPQ